MEAKPAGSTQIPFYYDFEPFCNWREEARDTLVLHLPEFNKEQLKIHFSTNTRVLKISGERARNASQRSRFYKEVKVSNECNVNDMRANFVNGHLYVVMPKKISAIGKTGTNSEFQLAGYAKKAIKVGLAVALGFGCLGFYLSCVRQFFTC